MYVRIRTMPEDKIRSAVDETSLVMRWGLRKNKEANKELSDSLGWFASEKGEKDERAGDFEFVNQRLNELMENPENLPPQFRDIALLGQDLKGRRIPSLEESRRMFYNDKKIAKIVTSTIEKAVLEYPSWAKVNPEYPSLGTPASGTLIEGFGAFLGSLVMENNNNDDQRAQISRHYVLAFEEVLLTERPNSPLLNDVIGWMKEEVDAFPEEIKPIIRQKSFSK